MTTRLHESLGIPIWLCILLSLPGLALFEGVFAYATYRTLGDMWPWLTGSVKIGLALVFPIIAFVIIIGVCTIWETKANDAAWQPFFRVYRILSWVISLVILAVLAYRAFA